MPNIKKANERDKQRKKLRYGQIGNGAGADRRPESVRTDRGLPRRLVKRGY